MSSSGPKCSTWGRENAASPTDRPRGLPDDPRGQIAAIRKTGTRAGRRVSPLSLAARTDRLGWEGTVPPVLAAAAASSLRRCEHMGVIGVRAVSSGSSNDDRLFSRDGAGCDSRLFPSTDRIPRWCRGNRQAVDWDGSRRGGVVWRRPDLSFPYAVDLASGATDWRTANSPTEKQSRRDQSGWEDREVSRALTHGGDILPLQTRAVGTGRGPRERTPNDNVQERRRASRWETAGVPPER
jgi:hypothetical protein